MEGLVPIIIPESEGNQESDGILISDIGLVQNFGQPILPGGEDFVKLSDIPSIDRLDPKELRDGIYLENINLIEPQSKIDQDTLEKLQEMYLDISDEILVRDSRIDFDLSENSVATEIRPVKDFGKLLTLNVAPPGSYSSHYDLGFLKNIYRKESISIAYIEVNLSDTYTCVISKMSSDGKIFWNNFQKTIPSLHPDMFNLTLEHVNGKVGVYIDPEFLQNPGEDLLTRLDIECIITSCKVVIIQ